MDAGLVGYLIPGDIGKLAFADAANDSAVDDPLAAQPRPLTQAAAKALFLEGYRNGADPAVAPN